MKAADDIQKRHPPLGELRRDEDEGARVAVEEIQQLLPSRRARLTLPQRATRGQLGPQQGVHLLAREGRDIHAPLAQGARAHQPPRRQQHPQAARAPEPGAELGLKRRLPRRVGHHVLSVVEHEQQVARVTLHCCGEGLVVLGGLVEAQEAAELHAQGLAVEATVGL